VRVNLRNNVQPHADYRLPKPRNLRIHRGNDAFVLGDGHERRTVRNLACCWLRGDRGAGFPPHPPRRVKPVAVMGLFNVGVTFAQQS
jgi:hypothetical protein